MIRSRTIRRNNTLLKFLHSYRRIGEKDHDLPPLPKTVKNRLGNTVRLDGDSWSTVANVDGRGTASYPVGLLRRPRDFSYPYQKNQARPRRAPALNETFLLALQHYIIDYMRITSPKTSANLVIAFIHFERFLHEHYRSRIEGRRRRFSISDLDSEMFSAYGSYIERNCPFNGRYASFIRGFYIWGLTNRLRGFDISILRKIAQVQTFTSPKGGRLAKFRDPRKGPLVWEEEQQVVLALDRGLGNPQNRAVTAVIYETGIRPEAAGRIRSVQESLTPTPNPDEWNLQIPRVKQRSSKLVTFTRSISSRTAQLLNELSSGAASEFLFHWIGSTHTTKGIRDAVASWAKEVGLSTSRIAKNNAICPLPLTPGRFRRTLATNMADRGATAEEIAEALDDRSIAMAAVYASASSNIVDILAATLDRHPTWYRLLNLFLGRIDREEEASLPLIHGGVPYLAGFGNAWRAASVIGRCSNPSACNLQPPLSCYRCPYFLASRTRSYHEAQLEQLKAEIDSSIGIESDRMADVLTPTMAAIVSLIARLKVEYGLADQSASRRAARRISTRKISR